MVEKLIENLKNVKKSSNEAICYAAMAAVHEDCRYLELVEKFGKMNDDYVNTIRDLTEEIVNLRNEVNKLKYFKGV